MYISEEWTDYEILDTHYGQKLERWGDILLVRPDPQIVWLNGDLSSRWNEADARYVRSSKGGGSWQYYRSIPPEWLIRYKIFDYELTYKVKTMGFKHTGLFPEQAINWEWFSSIIRRRVGESQGRPKVLNLFGYTGGATVAAAKAGAEVCHVDAAKGMVTWAKDNAKLSGVAADSVRYIVDDAVKFVEREIRRGRRYDGIIMDPPSYGRGPSGEVWRFEDKVFSFVSLCEKLLSDNPLFFLLNVYTTGLSPTVTANIIKLAIASRRGGEVAADEVGLPANQILLPCGCSGRWSNVGANCVRL